jgi:hypothetical protein
MMNIETKGETELIIKHVLHIDNASQHLAESKFDSMGIR